MPQVSQAQKDQVLRVHPPNVYVGIAKREGAELQARGVRLGDVGYFVAPTIMTGNNSMKAFREEIFRLVAAVINHKTEEEAIQVANNIDYGLAAAVFTENSTRAIRVSHAYRPGLLL